MMSRLCLIAALSCFVTPALAGPYDGIYKQAANSECALVGVDGGSVEISDGIFHGVEVSCRMDDPVNVVDMDALLYTMQCSGEDQGFSARAMLMNKAQGDGIIMVWDGYAFVYDRCPEPGDPASDTPVAGTATDASSAPTASAAATDAGAAVEPTAADAPVAPAAD